MNIVATRATRAIARQMIDGIEEHGADAVLKHIHSLKPEQFVPLVALLAKAAATGEMPVPVGQPEKVVLLTEEERKELHRLYGQGKRDPHTIRGEREYKREKKRAARAAQRAMRASAEREGGAAA